MLKKTIAKCRRLKAVKLSELLCRLLKLWDNINFMRIIPHYHKWHRRSHPILDNWVGLYVEYRCIICDKHFLKYVNKEYKKINEYAGELIPPEDIYFDENW